MPFPITGLLAIEEGALELFMARVEAVSPETLALAYSEDAKDKAPYAVVDGVATLDLKGVMLSGMGWLAWLIDGTDTDAFTAKAIQMEADPNVKAVLLDTDTPGGMVKGCVDAAQAIQALSKKKPVHAYVGDQCSSAGLFVASQARTIHGGPLSSVGSIGALQVVRDSSKAAAANGVKVHVVSSGPMKGAGTPGTEVTPEQLAEWQRHVDAASTVFQSFLATGRKMKPDAVAALADGRSWTGKEAVSKGLLDGITSRIAVMDALRGYHPGRKAVHIAAETATGEKTMSRMDSFIAWIKGEAETPEEKPQAQDQPILTVTGTAPLIPIQMGTFVGDTVIRKELDELKAEQARIVEAAKAQAVTANREATEAWMKKGLFPAADLEKNVERRAQNPALFDEMMGERKIDPLASSAVIDGNEALKRIDPTAQVAMLDACKNYYKTSFRGIAASSTAEGA